MNSTLKYFSTVLFIFLFQNLSAQDEKVKSWKLNGYVKYMFTTIFFTDPDSVVTSNLIHNRLNFKWDFAKSFYTRIEMRNRIYFGEQIKLIPDFGKLISEDDGYINPTKVWLDKNSVCILTNFDRALVNLTLDKSTFTIGRQRINWGINTIWNPNDLFNAYNFLDFDYEERPGVDAIRVRYFRNSFSSVELAYKPSKEKDRAVGAMLYKFNKWKYDFQFLGGVYYTDFVVGAGWAGNIKDAGFKGEVSYFKDKSDFNLGNDNITGSMTFDYSLKNEWYVSAAALYVQNPIPYFSGTINTFSNNLSAKSLMPYNFSIYTSAMKSFTPILSGTMAVIYSPEDNSTIFFPVLTYNVAENFIFDFTAQSFFSDESGTFKSSGNYVYLRLRMDF